MNINHYTSNKIFYFVRNIYLLLEYNDSGGNWSTVTKKQLTLEGFNMFVGILGALLFVGGLSILILGFVQQLMKKPLLLPKKISASIAAVGIILFFVGALDGSDTEAKNSSDTSAQTEAAASESAEKRASAESVADAEIKAGEEAIAAEKEAKAAAESQAAAESKATEEKAAQAAEEAALFDKSAYRWDVNYDNLARTPDDFIYQKIALYGRVVQVMEGDGTTQLRVAVNDDYNSVVLVEYDSSISSMRVLEDDYVDMYGTSAGLFTYSSTMGGEITIPALLVYIIEIRQ